MTGLTSPEDMTLIPFYATNFQRYTIYWPLQTATGAAQATQEAAQTLDRVRIGEPVSETAHDLQSDGSHTGNAGDPFSHWRDAKGFFSYAVQVAPGQPATLRCAYWGSDANRTFDIQIDGTTIGTQSLAGAKANAYLFADYPIPATLTQDKHSVTVRFVPHPGSTAGGLFDLRVLRA
jgi:hypothetical protein